jgi:uncharacterized repeat protein (TIGR01451 family)
MTPGGTSALAILLSNPNTDVFSGTVNNVQFSMSNVPVAPGGLLENTCGASLVVTATSVQLTDGTLQAAGSCVIIVNLAGNAPGQVALDTGPITSSNAPAGSAAAATLTVASGTLLAAPGAETTFAPNLISIGGTTQLTIRLTNHDANNAVTGVQLFDIYPFGITNAPSALVSNTCGGGLTLRGPNPDFDLLLIGGTIPAGGQCSLVVNVVGTDESFPSNFVTVGPFGNAPTPNGPSATIHVVTDPLLGAPSAVEQFVPPTVAVGASSAMTVQLTNNNNTPINGTQFNEHYPSGFSNTSSAVVSTNTCGGTLTADANGNMLSLANGVIPAAATCTITVNVVGNAQGSWFSQTGAIVSSNAFEGSTAVGGLSVTGSVSLAAPTVSKDFSPQSIAVGDTSTLTLTLTNNDANTAVTGVQLSDPYPGGMANASSAVLVSNSCGGSVTAPTSGFSMSLSGGTIPAAGSCQIKLHVVGTAPGAAINQTEPATSTNADPGNPATATLTVTGGGGATPQSISFTSTAPNNAFVGGPTYHATASATSARSRMAPSVSSAAASARSTPIRAAMRLMRPRRRCHRRSR